MQNCEQTSRKDYRGQYVSRAETIVVKIGTNVLSTPNQRPDESRIEQLSDQIAGLIDSGKKVALVSSGAIGYGMAELGLQKRPTTLSELQGTASVGQAALVGHYDRYLRKHGLHAGQILLTRDDFDSRERYNNASNTIQSLFDHCCVPVINENDTISTEEIQFGDNDLLAAFLTHLIKAELLIILTTVPGVYGHNPLPEQVLRTHRETAENEAHILDVVKHVTDDILNLDTGRTSPNGTGGMATKLEAARIATEAGEAALIADGREKNVLQRICAGENIGTLFLPTSEKIRSKKRWIRFASQPRGEIQVDKGAEEALCKKGKSLLPSGVIKIRGRFQSGDLISIKGADQQEIARGLTNYSADELKKIRGCKTSCINDLLGRESCDEVVHRDNMALV